MSSSAAAVVRVHPPPADIFPAAVRGGGGPGRSRQHPPPRDSSSGTTAFPFSFPEPGDLSESGSNASDDAAPEEDGLNHHHSSSSRRGEQPAVRAVAARTRSFTRRRGVTTKPSSDMLEVAQPLPPVGSSRGVSPSRPATATRPRSAVVATKLPVSPRKISLEASAEAAATLMDIFIQRDSYHEDFGFDITGGCDSGYPLTVSAVVLGGPADLAGLWPDDVVLALDNIKAAKLSHADTVQFIKTALQIQMRVQRNPSSRRNADKRPSIIQDGEPTDLAVNRKHRAAVAGRPASMSEKGDMIIDLNHQIVPSSQTGGHSSSSVVAGHHKNKHSANTRAADDENDATGELNNQAYAWIDIGQQPCSPPPEEDTLSIAGDSANNSSPAMRERKCTLVVSDDVHLGLLIRGGLDYGLGIYVTGLDKASAAEAARLQTGDQILSVNNVDFRRISHADAVRILRTHRHMTLKVRHVGKLPYARRLTPSSLSSSSSIIQQHTGAAAQDNNNLQSLFTNAALLTDPAEEEIDRLTREAMWEQMSQTDDMYYENTGSAGDLPYEAYMLDLELDDEVLRLKRRMREKREQRPRAGRIRSSNTDYWTDVVERNADMLLKDENETGALMYFLDEYGSGALCVDALLLSLFHTMALLPNFQLLDDIRNLIAPQDISRYDSLLSGMKTELMTSPGTLSTGMSRSFTNLLSPSMFNLDEIPIIKPLPPAPLKSAIKASVFSKNSQAPTVVDPISYGPIDVVLPLPPAPVPVPAPALPDWTAVEIQQNGSQWLQSSSSLPVQQVVPVQPPGLLYTQSAVGSQYMINSPLPPVVQGYPEVEQRMRFADFAAQMGHTIGQGSQQNSVWPYGRKSYSIDCLPQSVMMHPDGRGYGMRQMEPENMRRRPSYVDSYSYPNSSMRMVYDYSDTPAGLGIARSTSKLSDRRRSHLDEESDHISYDSDDRPRNHRNHRTPTPPEPPANARRRNRSVASSMDESHHALFSSPKSRKDEHRKDERRRISSSVDETVISDFHPAPTGIPISKSRPQSLHVPTDPSITANGDANSPLIIETISVKKTVSFLGLAIEGGTDTNYPLPRIINIQRHGCAHINGHLKVGHCIVSVNGQKLENLCHADCVSLITGLFANKDVTTLDFVVKNTVRPVAT